MLASGKDFIKLAAQPKPNTLEGRRYRIAALLDIERKHKLDRFEYYYSVGMNKEEIERLENIS